MKFTSFSTCSNTNLDSLYISLIAKLFYFPSFAIGVSSYNKSFNPGSPPTISSTPNFLKKAVRCYGLFIDRWNFAVLNKVTRLKYGWVSILFFSANFLSFWRAELFASKTKLKLKPLKILVKIVSESNWSNDEFKLKWKSACE